MTEDSDDNLAEDAAKLAREMMTAVRERLPPHYREALRRKNRSERLGKKSRAKQKRALQASRQHRIVEMLTSGHSQADIARTLRISEATVSETLSVIWPYSNLKGRNNRFLVLRISTEKIDALELLAKDMCLVRSRALEEIVSAVLDDDAAIARRTLRVVRA